MKRLFVSTIIIVLFQGLWGQAIRELKDINYAGDTLTGHLLDIYLPDQGEGPFPVIISVAGSAFLGNNTKDQAYQLGKPLQDKGFAIVAVNHRSSHNAIFPAQINDMKAVARFVRGNTSKYNLDTRFIGMTGNSSGGHLSALMGTTTGVESFAVGLTSLSIEGDLGDFTGLSSHVDAVVDWYGPTDFQVMDSCGSEMVHNAVDSPESILVGGAIQEKTEMCALANPITYIDKDDVPMLILHGDADPLVPYCQSVLLYDALYACGVKCRLIIVPGAGHGKGIGKPEYINEMISFFIGELEKKPVNLP